MWWSGEGKMLGDLILKESYRSFGFFIAPGVAPPTLRPQALNPIGPCGEYARMQCYAFSIKRGRGTFQCSYDLVSLAANSILFAYRPSAIRTYNFQARYSKRPTGSSSVFEIKRSQWMGTDAASRVGREQMLTDDPSHYPSRAQDGISPSPKFACDLFQEGLREEVPCLIDRRPREYSLSISNRARLRRRPSPPASLALFLESKARPNRSTIKRLNKLELVNESWDSTLPGILLRYLFLMQHSQSFLPSSSAIRTLRKYGLSIKDVELWAYIVMAPSDEEAVQRYISSASVTPTFILLDILRRPRVSAESLKLLLIKSWNISLGIPEGDHRPLVSNENELEIVRQKSSMRPIEDNTFTVLVARLLRHARQVWPPAVINITRLTIKYCKCLASKNPRNETGLTLKLHARLSKIYNFVIRRLSHPTSVEPVISATYSWEAQRIILETISHFQPALELDRKSYRAVSRALLALKKSPHEEKFSRLIKRSWPPWRKEIDGMDANRAPDEDISRAVAALSLMQQAGFAHEPVDKAVGIYGGREPDGTPTIQTRFLMAERSVPATSGISHKDMRRMWAARISATRDAQEAWAAFLEFSASERQKPSMLMYHAMYEKLIFNAKLHDPRVAETTRPGDGKEVIPIRDDNVSDAEKLRMQPPTLDELYAQMIRDNIRPSGRCAALLIEKANSFERVVKYLSDSGIDSTAVDSLLSTNRPLEKAVLERIPGVVFVSYIRFLSRLSRLPSHSRIKAVKLRHHRFRTLRSHAFQHALRLMKCRQSPNAHAWTSLFQAVANHMFALDSWACNEDNSVMAWQLLEAVLQESYAAGARLEPSGFQYICYGLEKVLLSSAMASESGRALVLHGHKLIKDAFAKLAHHVDGDEYYQLPRLFSGFSGSNLHAYVRVLGLLQDVEEIEALVRWMIEYQQELGVRAASRRNGMSSFRRTLVAIRAFTDHDTADRENVDKLAELVSELSEWGGWPSDSEVEAYLNHGTNSEGDGSTVRADSEEKDIAMAGQDSIVITALEAATLKDL